MSKLYMQPANSILNTDLCHFRLRGNAIAISEGGAFLVKQSCF